MTAREQGVEAISPTPEQSVEPNASDDPASGTVQDQATSCQTYRCQTSAECTAVCGDVARCFFDSMGCGPGPYGCCVLM